MPARVTKPRRCTIPFAMNAPPLRRGWTTGAWAAAAAKAAYLALLTAEFPDPVEVTLPKGPPPSFAFAVMRQDQDSPTAGIVTGAGDHPPVPHGPLVPP